MEANSGKYWAGVDWGDKTHVACAVSEEGDQVYGRSIPHSTAGIADLVAALRQFERLAGIAIETPRHVLVDALPKDGFTVYPVNPKQ
jgi:predicted NBD/HSP70 family sugar kinase